MQVKQAAAAHTLEAGQRPLTDVSWVLHDRWGYYFPGNASIEISNRSQTGDWNGVLKRMPSNPIQSELFTLWFNHHTKPQGASYVYYVFPAATAGNIAPRAAPFQVLENTARLQVVENTESQLAGFVFAAAGEATGIVCKMISADKPCVLMVRKEGNRLNLTVSDPTHQLVNVTIGLPGKRKTDAGAIAYNTAKDMSLVTVALPQGPLAGRSVCFQVE